MKSIQNKGINLTAEDLKNRIADRKERYTKQQARREKLEQTMENTRNDIEPASLPVFPVFSTTFSTACTVA